MCAVVLGVGWTMMEDFVGGRRSWIAGAVDGLVKGMRGASVFWFVSKATPGGG